MPNSKFWLIVADAGRAALYAAESPTGPLTELRDVIGPKNRLLDQDLVTDRPGRAFDSGGQGRHALEPSTPPGEVETERFAQWIAETLDQARTEQRFEKLGLEVETLTAEIAEHLNVNAEHGVVISDVLAGSPADRAGLKSGMVIVEAARKPVKSVADLKKAVEEAKDGGLLLLVRSEQGARFLVLKSDA